MQAETQAQLQSAETQLQDDDGSARPQMQQEQQGSLLQEGIWVIDLTVDDPTATDGGDTYMVSAALMLLCHALLLHISGLHRHHESSV